jgi:PIN domain nuclease of toxin-antitoxin system
VANPGNELIFGAASMWEIAIRNSLARDDFRVEPRVLRRGLLDNGYTELPQALVEGITLLTADAQLARYRGPVRKV